MQFVARPVLKLITGKLSKIDWENLIRESAICTFIPKMFSVVQYKCGLASLSIYPSGIITASGKIDFNTATDAIHTLTKFLKDQDLHDGSIASDLVVSNEVFQLDPVGHMVINLKSLVRSGGRPASVFHGVDMKMKSGSTARIYSTGKVMIKGTRQKWLLSDVKEITAIFKKHMVLPKKSQKNTK